VGLRQPASTHVQPFRCALTCVRALLDFTMMAQYRSYTPETIFYMEEYATLFLKTKDILLEFHISKRTEEEADELHKEMRYERALMMERVLPSLKGCICDDNREQENDQRIDLIYAKSNFNFLKIL